MQHIQNHLSSSNLSNSFEPLDRSAFKILVLHEDTLTGVRATSVLERLTDQLEVVSAIKSKVWKFDSLSHPELWEQAAVQAGEADMVVVSACGNHLLPPCVRSLIEDALSCRYGRKAAVVALLDWDLELSPQPSPLYTSLRQLTEKWGMDFFCNTGESYFAPDLGSTLPRMERRTPALEPVGWSAGSRDWGIND